MLRPSSAHRWMYCTAAPSFAAALAEQPDTDASMEGTCAAWVADCVLSGDASTAEDMLDAVHSNGWVVTPDMVFYVQKYLDMIHAYGDVPLETERHVKLCEGVEGTLDHTMLTWVDTLLVTDLKFGYSPVEAFENWQTLTYGAARYNELPAEQRKLITKIVLRIFQPRAFHPDGISRDWVLTPQELMNYAQLVANQANVILNGIVTATPGEHCKHCPAANNCNALIQSMYKGYDVIEDTRQVHLTDDELTAELNFIEKLYKMVDTRKTALYAEAEQRLQQGQYIQGWGMVPGQSYRALTVEPTVIKMMTGIEPYVKKLMTPSQLEKEGVPLKTVEHLQTVRPGKRSFKQLPKGDFKKMFERNK